MSLSILLVTGQSGSGKSTALRALEDRGYYCVDNMPAAVVEQLILALRQGGEDSKLALGMDIRDRRFIKDGPLLVSRLRTGGEPIRVLYLDAKEEAIIRRYSETRRRHPLDQGCGLRLAIAREREILSPLREIADDILDTTAMSPHELRARVIEQVGEGQSERDALRVAFLSFGFKYGLPLEADIVFDVRFLPNPYFEPTMRERCGLDADVSAYALASSQGQAFLTYATDFLSFLIPQYQREGKRYLTVAIGCTGGRHRSVAVARELSQRLSSVVPSDLRHRELEERRP